MKTPKTTSEQIADQVVKQRRKRPDLTEMFTPHCAPGEISKWLSDAVEMNSWPAIDTNDAQQVADRIKKYHLFCINNDVKPDMSGVALALGVSRKTLWCWENGIESNKPKAVRDALKKARETNEYILVQMMNGGKINPIPALFLLKNNHGYKDQQDVVITPNTPLQNMDATTARQNMLESLPELPEGTE